MSKKKRRSGAEIARAQSGASRKKGGSGRWPLVGSIGLLVAGAAVLGLALKGPDAGAHPAPREGITRQGLMPAARYDGHLRIQTVYQQAARVPAVLDGLYCYCGCGDHMGHRSLYTCFETDHAAACDVCLSQASQAYRLSQAGQSLDQIREAVDNTFSSG